MRATATPWRLAARQAPHGVAKRITRGRPAQPSPNIRSVKIAAANANAPKRVSEAFLQAIDIAS